MIHCMVRHWNDDVHGEMMGGMARWRDVRLHGEMEGYCGAC